MQEAPHLIRTTVFTHKTAGTEMVSVPTESNTRQAGIPGNTGSILPVLGNTDRSAKAGDPDDNCCHHGILPGEEGAGVLSGYDRRG